MCQLEYDLTEFAINNNTYIIEEFSKLNTEYPLELKFIWEIQKEEEEIRIIKEFLLSHFPHELDKINLICDKNFVNLVKESGNI